MFLINSCPLSHEAQRHLFCSHLVKENPDSTLDEEEHHERKQIADEEKGIEDEDEE